MQLSITNCNCCNFKSNEKYELAIQNSATDCGEKFFEEMELSQVSMSRYSKKLVSASKTLFLLTKTLSSTQVKHSNDSLLCHPIMYRRKTDNILDTKIERTKKLLFSLAMNEI